MRKNILRSGGSSSSPAYVDGASTTDVSGDFSLDISSLSHKSGDVGLLLVTSELDDINVAVTGWTELDSDDASGGIYCWVFYRDMDGTETAVTSSSGNALTETCVSFICYENVDSTNIATDWSSVNANTGDVDPSLSAAVDAAEAMCVVLVGSGVTSSLAGLSSGYTGRVVSTYGSGNFNVNNTMDKLITTADNPGACGYPNTSGLHHVAWTVVLQEA